MCAGPHASKAGKERVPAIEDELAAIVAEIPPREWDRLPLDLTDDLDHYVYATPRRSRPRS